MNKNIYSLLSTGWMLTDDGQLALLPFLNAILKGQPVSENSIPSTLFGFTQKNTFPVATNDIKENSVAVLNIHHPIFKYDQTCGPKGTQSIIKILSSWEENPNIKGVVLDINSPGGQTSGTREFYNFIKNYSKPIVAYSNDIIGSAAYYFAAATDYIITSEYADFIGSIGVMYSKIDMTGAIEKSGGRIIEEYSDLSPEKNKVGRQLREGDSSLLITELLNPLAEQFHEDMRSSRPQIKSKAFKGDAFFPKTALKLGLIDEIGTLQTAIDKVYDLSKDNAQTQNTQNMKQYKNIQSVLGMETPFESNDQGVYLNEEQLDTIEASVNPEFAGTEQAVADATEPLNTEITQLKESATATENALNKVFEDAELERGEMSIAESMAFLSEKLEEYGSADGGSHTQTQNNADDTIVEEKHSINGLDVSGAFDN